MRRKLINCCLVVLALSSFSVWATTIVDFSLRDQISWSHDCVRVKVISRDLSQSEIARYDLQIVETIYGSLSGEFPLELNRTIVGMPKLEPGQEYVLFLNLNNDIEKVIGLVYGTFGISGKDEVLTDGNGNQVGLKQRADRTLDFAYDRKEPTRSEVTLTYPQLQNTIRATHAEFMRLGGKQPLNPVAER